MLHDISDGCKMPDKGGVLVNRIRELRKKHNMTQAKLAERIGSGQNTLSYWERGIYDIDTTSMYKMADLFGVSVDYLLGRENARSLPSQPPIPEDAVDPPQMYPVPIVSTIPAGIPIFSEMDIEGYEMADVRNPEGHVYLRVRGSSMVGAGILDGDLALIRLQPTADTGDIVAAQVNGDHETTLKRFKREGSTVLLMPANPAYEPIVLTVKQFEQDEARIFGVLVGIQRKY